MGVPSGSFVVEGITDWLGEMPVSRGCRSKGSFCESLELELFSAGGRPQAQRLSTNRTTATRSARVGIFWPPSAYQLIVTNLV
jgi:hypothetical protein